MADDSGEQQQLGDVVKDPESPSLHERILGLYNGDSIRQITVGFWGKVLIEFAIVSVPVGAIVLPLGLILAYFDIGPFTQFFVISGWIGFSTTVFGITWCFLEAREFEPDEENEADTDENQE